MLRSRLNSWRKNANEKRKSFAYKSRKETTKRDRLAPVPCRLIVRADLLDLPNVKELDCLDVLPDNLAFLVFLVNHDKRPEGLLTPFNPVALFEPLVKS